ncbi:MAG: DM13 domain-containing protein [Parcubacteria group bacterium]|nr:DM13 domain-containing protein [Parcubacteria group bacterium]
MKKIIIIVTSFAVLSVAWWLGSPLFINKNISEKAEDIQKMMPITERPQPVELAVVYQGNFIGADDFHKAEGTAKLLKAEDKYFIRFEDNFKVTNGPDLFIYFGKNGSYTKEAKISALKGNIGGQNYEIPADINPLDYNEIWVWCRAFSVPFGHAVLK